MTISMVVLRYNLILVFLVVTIAIMATCITEIKRSLDCGPRLRVLAAKALALGLFVTVLTVAFLFNQ